MKKFYLLLSVLVLCTACSNRQPAEWSATDSITETQMDTGIITAAESIEILDTCEFKTGDPCKSLSIIEKSSDCKKQFVINNWDGTEAYIDIPESENPLSFYSVMIADLNHDGVKELIVSYDQCYYYTGFCILDMAENTLMNIPCLAEGSYAVGVPYEVLSVNDEKIEIVCEIFDYDEIFNLSYEEILEAGYSDYMSMSEDEYLRAYQVPAGETIGYAMEVGFSMIEAVEYDEIFCLKLTQPVCGPWGRNDAMGYMDTIVSWDSEGNYHLEWGTFRKEKSN